MGFLAPILSMVGSAIGGGLSGAGGARPPSLDPTQRNALDSMISQFSGKIGEPTIDPTQQKLMYGQIAGNTAGANARTMHQFAGAGLGHSGLLGYALNQNSMEQTRQQGASDLALQQQAIQQRNQTIQQIIQMLGIGNVPGQSPGMEGAAGAFNGIAGPLAMYSVLNGGGPSGGSKSAAMPGYGLPDTSSGGNV